VQALHAPGCTGHLPDEELFVYGDGFEFRFELIDLSLVFGQAFSFDDRVLGGCAVGDCVGGDGCFAGFGTGTSGVLRVGLIGQDLNLRRHCVAP